MFNDNNFFSGGAAEAGFYDHPIEQSLRFNDDDSAYLSWTPASAGNRKTFTQSFWMKRGNIGSNQKIWTAGSSGTEAGIQFYTGTGNDAIEIYQYNSGYNLQLDTSQLFRDTSSWYHIVVAWDTTQATASDRVKLYVNGEQVTAFSTSTYPSQNLDTFFNSTSYTNYIGWLSGSTAEFDGYMAEVNFIDGTALDPTSFGETKSGVWIPKAYTGSYGTNGFYLDFDGTYYNDKSGNGNNWTANNLAATDVVLDSPTNNFAVLADVNNPTDNYYEGRLKFQGLTSLGSPYRTSVVGTVGVSSGKWYYEARANTKSNGVEIGFCREGWVSSDGADADYKVFGFDINDNYVYTNDSSTNDFTVTGAAGDILGVAIDIDAGTATAYINGTSKGSVTGLNTSGYHNLPYGTLGWASGGQTMSFNFGQDSSFHGQETAQGNTDDNGYGDFYYAPPTGYLALCTANLEVPDAMNPALDNSPQDYFNTVLWSGDGTTTGVYISGVGFQPDLVWATGRNVATYPILTDVLRGNQKFLFSNATDAEFTSAKRIEDFQADGFNAEDDYYISGRTYVAWNWKANGSGVSNTDGSITSTVSANTDAGFSIVSYTGNATSGATLGHGLTQAPEMAIFRRRTLASDWYVYHTDVGGSSKLKLNTTNASSASTDWPSAPTSSVFTIGSGGGTNSSGYTYIAYMFHSVEGFSKFGSYSSNDATNGPFIYTGFKPAMVIVKRATDTQNWIIYDNKRDVDNEVRQRLFPDTSGAESGYNGMDFLSNGFKIRINSSQLNYTADYIYMAFAENPFKYSTAR